jgi:hypothetical protein
MGRVDSDWLGDCSFASAEQVAGTPVVGDYLHPEERRFTDQGRGR